MTSEYTDNTMRARYGIIHNGIFFIDLSSSREKQKITQNKLIKDFYILLNNKKTFDRDNMKTMKNQKLNDHLAQQETHRPQLA